MSLRERPLVLDGQEVRDVLAGLATRVRRPIGLPELHPSRTPGYAWTFRGRGGARTVAAHRRHPGGCWQDLRTSQLLALCPFGGPGDRLWVRETWVELRAVSPLTDEPLTVGAGERLIEPPTQRTEGGRLVWNHDGRLLAYRANTRIEFCDGDGCSADSDMVNRADLPRWRPATSMPRWASRLTLAVAAVRVVRLTDLAPDDALRLGARPTPGRSGRGVYAARWNARHGAGAWDADPWCWEIDFTRIDEAPAAPEGP